MTSPESGNKRGSVQPAGNPGSSRRSPITGERRVVTILFCDVVGSTRMAEGLDPEDWAEIMDAAFELMIAPVIRYEGTVARLMGDGILALFGAPISHEDDSQRALLAGLAIIEDMEYFQDRVRSEHGLDFKIRVGINTGQVVVGEVGSDQAGEYTAMGDAVNLASRLQDTAEPGTVHVSEFTYQLTKKLFEYESLGELNVKGREAGVSTFQLIGPKDSPESLRGLDGLASPLVGRDQEKKILADSLDNLWHGRGGIVSIIGDAGLGKTRLINELKAIWDRKSQNASHSVEDSSQPGWLEVRGISYDRFQPYSLFKEETRSVLGINDEDNPSSIRDRIKAFVERRLDEQQRDLAISSLEVLLGVQENKEYKFDAELIKRQIHYILKQRLQELAAYNPTVAVFDDLHWADPASVEAIQNLMELTNETPLLFILSMRPDRSAPGWRVKFTAETEFPHRYSEIYLTRLNASSSKDLVHNLLAISNLKPTTQALILEKAEGNPFFIEELIRTLIDNRVIAPNETGDRWVELGPVDTIDLPDNLLSLIIARIDRLKAPDRRTLQLASVIGRNFSWQVLEKMDPENTGLSSQLNTLERMGLVEEHARIPHLEYRFIHDLTRDAAYHSILRRLRREYHLIAGHSIEDLYLDQLEGEAHRLANHFDQGRDWQKAVHYYQLAAEDAARVYANEQAISQYERAIDLADKANLGIDELTSLYLRRGRLLELSNRFKEALENYEVLEKIGVEKNSPSIEAAALIPQATIYAIPFSEQDPEKSFIRSQRALELSQSIEDPEIKAKALWNLLLYESNHTHNYQKAIEYGNSSIEIARQFDLQESLAFALHDLSRAYQESYLYEDSLDAALEAGQLFQYLNMTAMIIDNLTLTADIYFTIGELEKAKAFGSEAQELSRKIGSLWGQGYSAITLAPIHFEFAEYEKAIVDIEQSLEIMEDANFQRDFFYMSIWLLSFGYGSAGNLDRAFEYAANLEGASPYITDEIIRNIIPLVRRLTLGYLHYLNGEAEIGREMLGDLPEPDAWFFNFPSPFPALIASVICEIAVGGKDLQAVIALVEAAIQNSKKSGARPFMADLILVKGLAFLAIGEQSQGEHFIHMALEEAEAIGSRRAIFKILAQLIKLETNQGHIERAAELRSRARTIRDAIAQDFTNETLRDTYLNSWAVRQIEVQ